jgi:SAM-dependent methyltransferase
MERLWAEAESAYRLKILDELTPDPSAVLLDVGCEDGAWTDQVRKKLGIPPSQVHGLEIESQVADRARARGFDIRLGDLESPWPFKVGSIDIVHANQVIEHVKRLDHFVEEIRRVLVPGGVAIVCTENLASWHNVGALALGFQPFSLTNISNLRPIGNPFALHSGEEPVGESWQHVHVVTLAALRDLFVAHGFTITTSWGTGYHPLPGPLGAALATLDPRHAHFIGVVARASP